MKPNDNKKAIYKCQIMGCEFKTRALDPRCPKCSSRMVKKLEK